jgi:hypothetical protein
MADDMSNGLFGIFRTSATNGLKSVSHRVTPKAASALVQTIEAQSKSRLHGSARPGLKRGM